MRRAPRHPAFAPVPVAAVPAGGSPSIAAALGHVRPGAGGRPPLPPSAARAERPGEAASRLGHGAGGRPERVEGGIGAVHAASQRPESRGRARAEPFFPWLWRVREAEGSGEAELKRELRVPGLKSAGTGLGLAQRASNRAGVSEEPLR